eukprot:533804-Prymnesium_polylepis.1
MDPLSAIAQPWHACTHREVSSKVQPFGHGKMGLDRWWGRNAVYLMSAGTGRAVSRDRVVCAGGVHRIATHTRPAAPAGGRIT